MLTRLAYLTITHLFAAIRLLWASDHDKAAETLALRHQLDALLRKRAPHRVAFTAADRTFLAALLHHLPRASLGRLRLPVRPDTLLRWHRELMRHRHARTCAPKRPGRPRTVRSIRVLVLRLARENHTWGYRRIHGELTTLGIKVAASTVWEILRKEGIDPAPQRTTTTWAVFLRSQADALLAMDFLETISLTGQRQYILAVIEHGTRRIRILGTTARPTHDWVTQSIKNLAMDLADAGARARFLIRDRDMKYPALMDEILAKAGIRTVLAGVRIPRMNSHMERWVRTCRRELLDHTLIWNERHLRHTLREFEHHYNEHRPHRSLQAATPLRALPNPITDPDRPTRLDIHRRDRLAGTLHEYRHVA
ncbi:integrase core domain-containing protein [Streptomyces sp. NPDC055239]